MTTDDFNANDYVVEDPKFDFFVNSTVYDDAEEYFEDSVFICDRKSVYVYDVDIPSGASRIKQWLRPHQFTNSPAFFVDGCDAGDVIQGKFLSDNNCSILLTQIQTRWSWKLLVLGSIEYLRL
jgi:hypothetical protein